MLEALGRLVDRQPLLRCLIVGEGRSRAELVSQVEQIKLQKIVHFTGFRDDIPALLGASDLFCLPSLSEGLPYALLESVAHNVPLLVTQVGGMAELLQHGRTAFLVPPSDPDALAEGIQWCLDHPEETSAMSQKAHEWLRQTFNPQKMIDQTLTIYQS